MKRKTAVLLANVLLFSMILPVGARVKAQTSDTLLPPVAQRFAWAGHLGMSMVGAVVDEITYDRISLH